MGAAASVETTVEGLIGGMSLSCNHRGLSAQGLERSAQNCSVRQVLHEKAKLVARRDEEASRMQAYNFDQTRGRPTPRDRHRVHGAGR